MAISRTDRGPYLWILTPPAQPLGGPGERTVNRSPRLARSGFDRRSERLPAVQLLDKIGHRSNHYFVWIRAGRK